MSEKRLQVVCVNYTFTTRITTAEALLDRYETLVSWAESLKAAGVLVAVVQRFRSDLELSRNNISYRFVHDPTWKNGSIFDRSERMNAAVAQAEPDVVHVNGLHFARQAWRLKSLLRTTPVLLQDHANSLPRHWLNHWTLGRALRRMDAVSFVSREQAQPWFEAGLLDRRQSIVELMEGSSHFRLKSKVAARAKTGLTGEPLCLWVGRLDVNKDPLTVLAGFAKALPLMPNTRLVMVYSSTELLASIEEWLSKNPAVASHVNLLGQRPHAELEDVYNSADLFLLGSHREGSGYAVLEALSCGVVPIVTDIPSFRVLTGQGMVGGLWKCGDAEDLVRVLISRSSGLRPETRTEVRAYFEEHFQWSAIGLRAANIYRGIRSLQP